MASELPEWCSFWDLASSERGAATMMELYGELAAAAAADCANAAHADDRDEDYRFWTAVLARVRAAERQGRETPA
jgi:hypothetical protein